MVVPPPEVVPDVVVVPPPEVVPDVVVVPPPEDVVPVVVVVPPPEVVPDVVVPPDHCAYSVRSAPASTLAPSAYEAPELSALVFHPTNLYPFRVNALAGSVTALPAGVVTLAMDPVPPLASKVIATSVVAGFAASATMNLASAEPSSKVVVSVCSPAASVLRWAGRRVTITLPSALVYWLPSTSSAPSREADLKCTKVFFSTSPT